MQLVRSIVLLLLATVAHAFTVPLTRRAGMAHATRTTACTTMMADDEVNLKMKGSSLTLDDADAVAERKEKKALINKLIPGLAIAAFVINAATGGGLENIELPSGPEPPGMAKARALKEKSTAKSKAKYEELKSDALGAPKL